MGLLSKLHVVRKSVTNPSLKTFTFCFTPGRSSEHGHVLCGILVCTRKLLDWVTQWAQVSCHLIHGFSLRIGMRGHQCAHPS